MRCFILSVKADVNKRNKIFKKKKIIKKLLNVLNKYFFKTKMISLLDKTYKNSCQDLFDLVIGSRGTGKSMLINEVLNRIQIHMKEKHKGAVDDLIIIRLSG